MAWRSPRTAALAGLMLALGGCSPTAAYRSLTGIDKNDPNPRTAPFTANMAAAYDKPYPNLATVPPPPTTETTAAERQNLARSLVAERQQMAATLPAPPAVHSKIAAVSPAAAGRPAPTVGAGEKAVAAHQAPPRDSTLQMPHIAATLPQPEAVRPAPPAPVLAAVTPPAANPMPPAAAMAAAQPAPPPSVPVLAPIAPPAIPKKAAKLTPAPAEKTATIDLGGADEHGKIAEAAALYKAKPGPVRVVAYAAAPPAGGDPLAGYQAALDRAQAVAKALAAAGIAAGNIHTEAAASSGPGGRIEVELMR